MLRSIWRLPPTQSTFTFQERLDGSSIGELLDFDLPLKIVALAEEPAKQATKAGPFSWWMSLHDGFFCEDPADLVSMNFHALYVKRSRFFIT